MLGTVTNVNAAKKYAFAAPDDGSEDVFLPPNLAGSLITSGQLMSGSRVDFQVGTAAPGKKRPATSLRVIPPPADATPADPSHTPASATPPPAATANPAAPTQPAPKTAKYDPDKLAVKFLEVTLSGIYMLVNVWVNEASSLLRAYLEGDDDGGAQESYADAEGNAEFTILIPKGWENNPFLQVCVVVVYEGDQTGRPWRYTWRNPAAKMDEAETAPEPEAEPEPLQLTVTQTPGLDRMNFRVELAQGGKAATATITIASESGAGLRARVSGSNEWQQGPTAELECSGNTTVQLQWVDRIAGDNVYLGMKNSPTQSGPFYVSGHFRAPQTGA